MTRYGKRVQLLAISLSAVAGYVDAVGFIGSGGFFLSFMSGNTTRLGVGAAEHLTAAAIAGGFIASFVLGAMAGTLVGRLAGNRRRSAVLVTVAVLLGVAAALATGTPGWAAFAVAAAAMGAENAVFESEGEVRIGLTYMTGTLVKLAQRLTTALLGGDRWSWLPYLMLWLGLVSGAIVGALAYPRLGLAALSIAALLAAVLALVAWFMGPDIDLEKSPGLD